jgi:hypothetical protein
MTTIVRSRDSSVVWHCATGWMIGGSSPGGGCEFFLHHHIQTGSGAHPPPHPVATRGSFPGGKAAGAWGWLLTFLLVARSRMWEAIPPLPNMPSWRGAQLKDNNLDYWKCPLATGDLLKNCTEVMKSVEPNSGQLKKAAEWKAMSVSSYRVRKVPAV